MVHGRRIVSHLCRSGRDRWSRVDVVKSIGMTLLSRLPGTWIALISALCLAPTAGAIEFNRIGPVTATIAPGGEFTIDLAVENASVTSTFGVVGTVSRLAAAGAIATSGETSLFHFVQFCSPSNCFAGLRYPHSGPNPNDLTQGVYNPGDDSIVVVHAIGLAATSATGSLDPGLKGAPFDVPDPRDATLTLIANAIGVHVLTIDGTYSDGVNVLPIQSGTNFTVTVIPEPGSALLCALGLIGLSFVGRDRTERS